MNFHEESLLFYHEIAKCIMGWAEIEAALAKLVSVCLDNEDDREMIAAALFSIENFRSKVQFSSNLILRKFGSSSHINDLSLLSDRMNRASVKRNKIAHSKVMIYPDGTPGRCYALVSWTDLGITTSMVPHRVVSKTKKPPSKAICVRDLCAIQDEFFYIQLSLLNLRARFCGEQEPFPKCDEPVAGPPSLRELRNRIRSELGLQRQPSQEKPPVKQDV